MRISVGGNPVGMIGLEEIFSQSSTKQGWNEVELEKFLLEEAKKKNFIPSKWEEIYGKALLRAFKKYCGEEVKEASFGLQVRILGGGCANCQNLEREVLSALDEVHLAADFAKEEDPQKNAEFGVLGIPALIINGKVKSVARVPPKGEIKKWLQEGQNEK